MTESTYEIINLEPYGEEQIKRIDADGTVWFIPTDPANSDYQRYLRWLNGEEENGTIS